MKVESTVVEQLGMARKISISNNNTTLIADAASKDEIEMRIAQLKKELADCDRWGERRTCALVEGFDGVGPLVALNHLPCAVPQPRVLDLPPRRP
jgi:hypothetical protein